MAYYGVGGKNLWNLAVGVIVKEEKKEGLFGLKPFQKAFHFKNCENYLDDLFVQKEKSCVSVKLLSEDCNISTCRI